MEEKLERQIRPRKVDKATADTSPSTKEQLRALIQILEADPLCPIMINYPMDYGTRIFPRYRALMEQLKAIADAALQQT